MRYSIENRSIKSLKYDVFLCGIYLSRILLVGSTCEHQDKNVHQEYRRNCDKDDYVIRFQVLQCLFDCSKVNGVWWNKKFSTKRRQVTTQAFQERTVGVLANLLMEEIERFIKYLTKQVFLL